MFHKLRQLHNCRYDGSKVYKPVDIPQNAIILARYRTLKTKYIQTKK